MEFISKTIKDLESQLSNIILIGPTTIEGKTRLNELTIKCIDAGNVLSNWGGSLFGDNPDLVVKYDELALQLASVAGRCELLSKKMPATFTDDSVSIMENVLPSISVKTEPGISGSQVANVNPTASDLSDDGSDVVYVGPVVPPSMLYHFIFWFLGKIQVYVISAIEIDDDLVVGTPSNKNQNRNKAAHALENSFGTFTPLPTSIQLPTLPHAYRFIRAPAFPAPVRPSTLAGTSSSVPQSTLQLVTQGQASTSSQIIFKPTEVKPIKAVRIGNNGAVQKVSIQKKFNNAANNPTLLAKAVKNQEAKAQPKSNNPSPPVPKCMSCPICLSAPMNEPVATFCGHIFCNKCIKDSLKIKKNCPICNKIVAVTKIHRIFFNY